MQTIHVQLSKPDVPGFLILLLILKIVLLVFYILYCFTSTASLLISDKKSSLVYTADLAEPK